MTGIVAIIIMILRSTTISPSFFLKGGNLMQHRSYFVQVIVNYELCHNVCGVYNS